MAFTDVNGALPWWVTGAQPPSGAPTPPGARPTGMTSWYDYLASMFNPIGSAQAAEPSVNDILNKGGTPPVNNSLTDPSVVVQPPGPSSGPQPGLSAPNYTSPMLAAGAGPGAGLNAGTPLPAAAAPSPANPTAGTGVSTVTAPKGPLAGSSGGAGAVGSTSNPRFVPIDRPNMPAGGSGMARGGPPQMTALNLAGLFGGGRAANPADLPTPNAQPVSGPLARGGMSAAPLSMGPLTRNRMAAARMGPLTPDQIAAASLRQRYG